MNAQPFPSGLAKQTQFCNRTTERAKLIAHVNQNMHSVVIAPRRYGKTSLINQVLSEHSYPFVHIDLFLAADEQFIKKILQDKLAQLLQGILPKKVQIKNALIEWLKKLHPKIRLTSFGQSLEISTTQTPERSIVDLLLSMNDIAKKLEKKVVIVFDEFQQVGQINNAKTIEAAIRHAVERSEYVTYLFSGSHRHLLDQMFSNKARPLYHLCETMTLLRISDKDYLPFIKHHFRARWKKEVDNFIIEEILSLTENHPFYVNALCRTLWQNEILPDNALVQSTWDLYVSQQLSWIINELDRLSKNQLQILAALAHYPTQQPLSADFCNKIKNNPSSIKVSLNYLMKQDLVYKDSNGYYRVLDPAIIHYLRDNKYFGFLEN